MKSMDRLIDDYFGGRTGYSLEVEIPKFAEWLEKNHGSTLRTWLAVNQNAFLARAVGQRMRKLRDDARKTALRRSLTAPSLREFELTAAVGPKNLRMRIGDLTAKDHRVIAERYREAGERSRTLGVFHDTVADRLESEENGEATTREVLSETEYAEMRADITGEHGARPPLAEILGVGQQGEREST